MLRKVTFYRHLLYSCYVFLCNVFLMCFTDNFKTDPVLKTLFLPKSKAIKSVWQAFENYFYCVALLYIICLCLSALFGE